MRRRIAWAAALLLGSTLAFAQAGTNSNSTSQQEVKPGTGNGSEILLSPDINQKITGNVGYTEGATPDVSSYSMPATAGAVSNGAESTAAVSTAQQMTRQFIDDQIAREGGAAATSGEVPANAFNQGATPQSGQQPATEQETQHPGAEPHARTSSSQREKTKANSQHAKTKAQNSKMPQGDQAGQNAQGQTSQEPNYKSDHNSVSNRKDYSGKTKKKKAQPIENGFHKPGAPVKPQSQGQGQTQQPPLQR